ncbi:hypothetical protein AOLI_G00070360, partial [Acnodon oligacanthus]
MTITELPTSTEAALGLLGQIHQGSSDEGFYKLGFIVLSIVSGGLFLILTIYCLMDRKKLQAQVPRPTLELD